MKKLVVKESENTIFEIQKQLGRTEDSRYDHRLHGVLFVAKGWDCYEVAEILGHAPTTIENWVHAFNECGIDGLRDESRAGRPPQISDKLADIINLELRQNPRMFGYSQNLWDGKLLSYHLKIKYNLTIGVRQSQRLFHKFGFRQRKPRPVIARGDPFAQEAFKKNSLS
jgi:transposase